MSRAIKFRAWDGNVLIKVRLLEYVPAWRSSTGKQGYNVNQHLGISPENLMQFTGLHNKNGKEIYEGDIVKVSDKGYKGIIHWHKGRFSIGKPIDTSKYQHPYSSDFNMFTFELEIIGNIYENPELIE